jgi:hypothetical protein
MNSAISPNKAGLALGALAGGWHLLWSILVAVGLAQMLLDFIFRIHFIKPVYVVEPFNASLAATLVVVTAILGYVVGSVFAILWNKIHR